jgi:undecaprenyl phosphate-alpha-L-ara4N flippase subunit ArnE
MSIMPYGVILAAVAFEVTGQICFKRGAVGHPVSGDGRAGRFWIALARSGWTYAGLCAYGVELFLWIAALHSLALSEAFPLLSLSYCGVAIASRLFLNERVSVFNAAGIALITLGAACIAAGS